MSLRLLLLSVFACSWSVQAQILEVKPGRALVSQTETHEPMSAATEVSVSLRGRIMEANSSPAHDGKLMLVVSAELRGPSPVHAMLQIPLSSVAEAYGESRSCRLDAHGEPSVLWTAGLDEKNYVPFQAGLPEREFRLLLNKYLCRLLAAPARCGGREIELSKDVARWKLGRITQVVLQSKGAPARADISHVTLWDSEKPFDYAQCSVVAPSDGKCCVAGVTTAWHCGVAPRGAGWHQVSGDCFHRETGGRCKE